MRKIVYIFVALFCVLVQNVYSQRNIFVWQRNQILTVLSHEKVEKISFNVKRDLESMDILYASKKISISPVIDTVSVDDSFLSLKTCDACRFGSTSIVATIEVRPQISLSSYSEPIKLGICYSNQNTNPTVADNIVELEKYESGTLDFLLDGLKGQTTYYYRAYARIGQVVKYGEVKTVFTQMFGEVTSSNGHEYVDLGLPSKTKWATCNVGALTPYEEGDFYAWGETEVKKLYRWENYKFCQGAENTLTKYCTEAYWGKVDGKLNLEKEDDVAHVKWGGGWQIPSYGDISELLKNCNSKQVKIKGMSGKLLISRKNGNSVFFPKTGAKYDGDTPYKTYDMSFYWLMRVDSDINRRAISYKFDSSLPTVRWEDPDRCVGLPIRPVLK